MGNRRVGQMLRCLVFSRNEEDTLENYLVLWTSYLESENAMLQRRSNIIADVDKAAKALAKAKPNKVST